jgi:hypothetical protein
MPAVVVSRYHDVLAANPIARALSPGFEVGQNFSRWLFVDPTSKQLYPDWDEAAAVTVRLLRQGSADDPDDPRLLALINELSSASERFKQLWEQADVGSPEGVGHFRHPEVGDLYLTRTPAPPRPGSRPVHHHLACTSQQRIGARARPATCIAAKKFGA